MTISFEVKSPPLRLRSAVEELSMISSLLNIILSERVFIMICCVCFAGNKWRLQPTSFGVVQSLGRFGVGLFQLIMIFCGITCINKVMMIAAIMFFQHGDPTNIDKIMILVWHLCKARNKVVFLKQRMDVQFICDSIARHFFDPSHYGEQNDHKGKMSILPTHIQAQIGWHLIDLSFWKLNIDAAWSFKSNLCGLGWVFHDHLGRVHLAGLKFVPRCQELKILEAMTICFGLEILTSINISNILVESNCLEVINLLNDVVVDLSEVSYFIEEAKDRGGELDVVSFSMLVVFKFCQLTVLR